MNGKVRPAKFEPPPAQPMIMSGCSPAIAICSWASRPMTVWCSSTWLSTEPREYLVSSRVAASSTASLMAMPSEPGESGDSAEHRRGRSWSSRLGLATTCAPYVSMRMRRYGFWS